MNLNEIVLKFDNTEYETEQFPGLVYKLKSSPVLSNITFLLFGTGKIVITGAKSETQIKESVILLRKQLIKIGELEARGNGRFFPRNMGFGAQRMRDRCHKAMFFLRLGLRGKERAQGGTTGRCKMGASLNARSAPACADPGVAQWISAGLSLRLPILVIALLDSRPGVTGPATPASAVPRCAKSEQIAEQPVTIPREHLPRHQLSGYWGRLST